MEYVFGQSETAVLAESPPGFLYTPSLPAVSGQYEKQRSPWLYANTALQQWKTLVHYHHYFHKKSKAPHCVSLYDKNLTVSQPKPLQIPTLEVENLDQLLGLWFSIFPLNSTLKTFFSCYI